MEVSAMGHRLMGMSFGYGPAADKQEMITRNIRRNGIPAEWSSQAEVQGRRSPRVVQLPRPSERAEVVPEIYTSLRTYADYS